MARVLVMVTERLDFDRQVPMHCVRECHVDGNQLVVQKLPGLKRHDETFSGTADGVVTRQKNGKEFFSISSYGYESEEHMAVTSIGVAHPSFPIEHCKTNMGI